MGFTLIDRQERTLRAVVADGFVRFVVGAQDDIEDWSEYDFSVSAPLLLEDIEKMKMLPHPARIVFALRDIDMELIIQPHATLTDAIELRFGGPSDGIVELCLPLFLVRAALGNGAS